MKILFVLLALIVPLKTWAFCDGWESTDTITGAAYTAFTIQDWSQTRANCSRMEYECERNPVLGSHPSPQQINVGVVFALAGAWTIACLLPHEPRVFWFSALAFIEFTVTQNNQHGGPAYGISLPPLRF